eukprot:Gb_01990 [translate_table: standard]
MDQRKMSTTTLPYLTTIPSSIFTSIVTLKLPIMELIFRLDVQSTHNFWHGAYGVEDYKNFRDVSTNSFNGRIPSSFANLIELQEFRASSNNFIGNIPSYIGSWKNLKKLMIQGTSLEGPIPFISSSSLSDLRISDIALQGGSSLQFLQNLINLKILVLRNNLICGEIPKYLQNLRKLEIFFWLSIHLAMVMFSISNSSLSIVMFLSWTSS